MTCIVGIVDKQKQRTFIGADSAASNGTNIFVRKDTKVFSLGPFVIGCTSSFRMIQLLRFSFSPPKIETNDIYQYMCTDFINEIRKTFTSGGFLTKVTNGAEQGGEFLVGYKDRLFHIEADYQVGENVDGMDAIGCGMDFALGSLHTTIQTDMNIEKRIYKALAVSEYLSVGVKGPFHIISTQLEDIDMKEKNEISETKNH